MKGPPYISSEVPIHCMMVEKTLNYYRAEVKSPIYQNMLVSSENCQQRLSGGINVDWILHNAGLNCTVLHFTPLHSTICKICTVKQHWQTLSISIIRTATRSFQYAPFNISFLTSHSFRILQNLDILSWLCVCPWTSQWSFLMKKLNFFLLI